MIAGASPRFVWRPNRDGAQRTIVEACEIASRWGVRIPDDVQFWVDEHDYLDKNTTAKTTTFRELEGTVIHPSWLYHKKTGKIPFLIRKDILASDEAIVAVIGHEISNSRNYAPPSPMVPPSRSGRRKQALPIPETFIGKLGIMRISWSNG
jgi:hypothetical protein